MNYRIKLVIIFVLVNFLLSASWAQTGKIVGRIIDATTRDPLPFGNVFINNTTIGTTTEVNGEFALKNIPQPATYELVISFVGYETQKRKLNVTEEEIKLATIELKPLETELNVVDVSAKKDVKWEKDVKKFKKIFLGDDKQAELCEIQNPWILDFTREGSDKKFVARASEPIHIKNMALGYKLVFYLKNFMADNKSYLIEGNVRFEELNTEDDAERMQWLLNRQKVYQHSRQHLFKSMIDHHIDGEGFNLYTDIGTESATIRSDMFYSELDKTVKLYDTARIVSPTPQKNIYRIELKGRVEVHYRKERARERVYQDVTYPVSWIQLNKNYIRVNKDGFELNPADIVVSGAMSNDRVAHMLPLDYLPKEILSTLDEKRHELLPFIQEQIYVHLDKPYYYPSEGMWFKGYIHYSIPAMRDSLSRTVYVELINNNQRKIVLSKTLAIDSGFFYGDFLLPDTLQAGNYYLRAYTNLNRNFGDETLFARPVQILTLTQKIAEDTNALTKAQDSLLIITPDKSQYKTREKINLTLLVTDEDGSPLASHLSVSVTDATQVNPVEDSITILSRYPLRDIEKKLVRKELPYAVEYGIGFNARFLNDEGKPEQTSLNVIQVNPPNFTIALSDENGIFSVNGLVFFDTTQFSIRASKGKDKPYGKVEFLPKKDLPPLTNEYSKPLFEVVNTENVQRSNPALVANKNVRQLQQVDVKSTRTPEEYQADYRLKRPYGKPDYVLEAKDIQAGYGNLLLVLPGKFPGLIVREASQPGGGVRWVVYISKASTSSILNAKEVLVLINDVAVEGNPADILSSIDPSTVETVELKTGINVLYGSLSGSGILSVYTKKIGEGSQKYTDKNLPMNLLKVNGYSKPSTFTSPKYNGAGTNNSHDYRTLLYWNPLVTTASENGKVTISFFSSDMTGLYRVVVEGVTQNGKPIRSTSFLTVTK
jgi:hypothetical protein